MDTLEWCMTYGHRFPQDLKTALNFRDCRFAELAQRRAHTEEHFEAISEASKAAEQIINNH